MGEIQRIVDELLPDDGETEPGFSINSLGLAEWAMRKIARAEGTIQEKQAVAEDLIQQIRDRLDEITAPYKKTVEDMTHLLEPWGAVEIAKQGKKKSVKLLGGEIGFRQSPDSLDVTDEGAALAWLKDHWPQGVRVREEVDKKKVKENITFTGEVPDGCELKQGAVRFYVKAGLDAIEGKEAQIE